MTKAAMGISHCQSKGRPGSGIGTRGARQLPIAVAPQLQVLRPPAPVDTDRQGRQRKPTGHGAVIVTQDLTDDSSPSHRAGHLTGTHPHNPPRFGIAGDLYSQRFYDQMARVLKRKGRLFHYTGSPNKLSSGRDLAAEVAQRLRRAGFATEFNGDGVLALKN